MRAHQSISVHARLSLFSLLLATLALSLSAVGCGKPTRGPARAAVRGNITLEGDPLKAGVIRFIPIEETSGPMVFAKIENGRYQTAQFDGPVVGTHRVEIDQDLDDDPAHGANDPDEARTEYIRKGGKLATPEVPDIYNRNSTLRAEVLAHQLNTHDFDLDRRASTK